MTVQEAQLPTVNVSEMSLNDVESTRTMIKLDRVEDLT